MIPVNPFAHEFKVDKPLKTTVHVTYEVSGVDQKGQFLEQKRYSDFYKLRQVL